MGLSILFVSGAMICASAGAALRIALKIAWIIAMMDSSFAVFICAIYFYCYIYLLVSIPMDGNFVVAGVMVVAIC